MFHSPAVWMHLYSDLLLWCTTPVPDIFGKLNPADFFEPWGKVMETSAAASPPHQSAAVCLCSLWVVGGANLKKPTKVSLEVRLVEKDADGSCGL